MEIFTFTETIVTGFNVVRALRLGLVKGPSDADRTYWGPSAAARTDLGSCRFGNCTLGKIPLGSCLLGKFFWESTKHESIVCSLII